MVRVFRFVFETQYTFESFEIKTTRYRNITRNNYNTPKSISRQLLRGRHDYYYYIVSDENG